MPEKPHIKDRRINVFVSPEAKGMLRELGQAWYPNLKRPNGTVIEQLIRIAYAHSPLPRIAHRRSAASSRISDEFENKLDQVDEESAYLDAIDDDD
jgi:hypothetical protein